MGKNCFKCERVLPLSEFYTHPGMADGRLGKCKECTKADVRLNRRVRAEQYQEYDKQRLQTEKRKAQKARYESNHRERYPEKAKARKAVGNAIRDNRLTKQPCRVCGSPAHAHHPDYSKPLDVEWLCVKHHHELHNKTPKGT